MLRFAKEVEEWMSLAGTVYYEGGVPMVTTLTPTMLIIENYFKFVRGLVTDRVYCILSSEVPNFHTLNREIVYVGLRRDADEMPEPYEELVRGYIGVDNTGNFLHQVSRKKKPQQ